MYLHVYMSQYRSIASGIPYTVSGYIGAQKPDIVRGDIYICIEQAAIPIKTSLGIQISSNNIAIVGDIE